jgi:hypothetical protein
MQNPQIATQLVANSPTGSYNWSDDSQGLAHDDGHWFITQPMSLHKVPLGSSLGTDKPDGEVVINLPKTAFGLDVSGSGSWVGARSGANPSDPITLWTSIDNAGHNTKSHLVQRAVRCPCSGV